MDAEVQHPGDDLEREGPRQRRRKQRGAQIALDDLGTIEEHARGVDADGLGVGNGGRCPPTGGDGHLDAPGLEASDGGEDLRRNSGFGVEQGAVEVEVDGAPRCAHVSAYAVTLDPVAHAASLWRPWTEPVPTPPTPRAT